MTGTIINVFTILIGGGLGLLLGTRLKPSTRQTVLNALGLCTLALGAKMAFATHNFLIVIFSILIGGIVGERLGIETRLEGLGDALQRRFTKGGAAQSRVTEAFVTASVVFCVGPMAVLGSIQDGLVGDYQILAVKSLMDGFASMAFAAAMGWGVVLSALPILVYQGGIALAAMLLAGSIPGGLPPDTPAVVELGATGGVLVMAIGLRLLEIKRIPIGDYLPALAVAPLLVLLLQRLGLG
jgi:uncharacterized membrane protein YqgA involved in biofilm formation